MSAVARKRAVSPGALVSSAIAALALVAAASCGSGDLVVGDDSRSDGAVADGSGGDERDALHPSGDDGGTKDSGGDGGPPVACTAAPGGPGTCLTTGSACREAEPSLTCPTAGTFCCTQPCPSIAQPAPGFCDGGPYAPTYDSKACVVGFACAPVACTSAGGTCVGLAPGACTTGHVGDATKYSCGSGIGVMCCLP